MLFSAQKFDKGMVSGIPLCRKSELKLVPNFPIKLLQLAISHWPAQAAYREKSGLAYVQNGVMLTVDKGWRHTR